MSYATTFFFVCYVRVEYVYKYVAGYAASVESKRRKNSTSSEVLYFLLLCNFEISLIKHFLHHTIRLLFSSKEPEPLFVFEDATTLGFGLSAGPLNLEGTKFVITRLAKFHAASIYLDREVSKFNLHDLFDKKFSRRARKSRIIVMDCLILSLKMQSISCITI